MHGDQYHIKFVGGEALDGKDFAFLECDGEVWLALKQPITESQLERAWATFREMAHLDLAAAS